MKMYDMNVTRTPPTPGLKTCVKCKDKKPVAEFEASKHTTDGRHWKCRECRNGGRLN